MDLVENYLTEKESRTTNALFVRDLFSGSPSDAMIIFVFGTIGRSSSFNLKEKMKTVPQNK